MEYTLEDRRKALWRAT